MTKQQTLYLNQFRYNDLVYASRLLLLSKSTIINVLVREFLNQSKEAIKKTLDNANEKYKQHYDQPKEKVRTTWSLNSTFYKGVTKFCKKNNLSISFFVHLVLVRYSWLFMDRYQMSLKKKFNRIYERKSNNFIRYNYQRGLVV